MKILIKSEKEMHAFAAQIAAALKGGEVLALYGNLGSGKTTFTKGLARALGVKAVVQSPTFLLMKCYPVRRRKFNMLCHIDSYRVKLAAELRAVGVEEILGDPHAVTVIEWADRVSSLIPRNALRIRFGYGTMKSERTVTYAQPRANARKRRAHRKGSQGLPGRA
jgi:tRNA threonylcarbamoyladenosine biosynthesis protein TsaE